MKSSPPPPLLPGAVTAVLFALLAFSVNENAAAQASVSLCPASFGSPQFDPHGADRENCFDIPTNPDGSGHAGNFRGTDPSELGTCGECVARCGTPGLGALSDAVSYSFNGRRFCGPVEQCNSVDGVLFETNANGLFIRSRNVQCDGMTCIDGHHKLSSSATRCEPGPCPGERTRANDGTCELTCGTNQVEENDRCVCAAEHTNADTGGGLNCLSNTEATVCAANQAFAGEEDPHLKQHANCTEDRSFAIRSNPMQSCGLCSADAFENCPSPEILYTYAGRNFCGPESQCIAVEGTRSDGTLCCPAGEGHFGSECRAPNSSMECRTLNAQEPIFEDPVGFPPACRAATSDADCAGVFTPDLPIRDTDGSCRLPEDSTECDRASSGAEPIYAESETDNCRARNTDDCPGQILTTAGACESCMAGQRPDSAQTACECDLSTHIDVDTGPALDCRPICQGGRIRDDITRECRDRTGADCLRENPPEILSGTSCQSCVAPEVPNDMGTSCICPTNTHEMIGNACLALCDPDETRVAAGTCEETVELSSCAAHEELEDNACVECDENEFRGTGTSCAACPIANETRALGEAECSCNRVTHYPNATDGTCDDFATCGEGESRNPQTNMCSSTCDSVVQETGACEPNAVCNEPNQERVVATNRCDCVSPAVRQADDSCAENRVCDDPNQERNPADNACRCEMNYADSDTSTPELTCTLTPECDGDNQELDMTRNVCACEEGFTDRDDVPETLNCEMIPMCDAATEMLDQEANECVPRASCVPPDRIQQNGACEEDVVCTETGQGRNAANNECEVCGNARKLSDGDCVALTAADCLPAERFEGSACVLPEPGEWPTGATAPPYGEYEHGDCTGARWPWSIVQTADGLSELCHAPVNLLATAVPSSQTLDAAGERVDFCVLRGAASGDSVRCDDPTVFGNLGIPDAPAGLVTQTTATITITLSDGSIREATTLTAAVSGYLQVVHSGGSVAAVFPSDTTEAEITTATPLLGTISLEVSVSMTMTPPASGGGSSGGGGGGGAAAALIAVPVVLLGGYWLLGGFEYLDTNYNFNYSGENSDFTYRGDAGFDLNHGSLSSYVRAIQSDGDAVSYQSGISYKEDFYSLNYAAYESKSIYDYDLSARLNYGSGPWLISPTADAEFNYSADSEDWNAETSAGVSAAWTSHKWNIRAHSAFAGDVNHGLDLEFRF